MVLKLEPKNIPRPKLNIFRNQWIWPTKKAFKSALTFYEDKKKPHCERNRTTNLIALIIVNVFRTSATMIFNKVKEGYLRSQSPRAIQTNFLQITRKALQNNRKILKQVFYPWATSNGKRLNVLIEKRKENHCHVLLKSSTLTTSFQDANSKISLCSDS